LIVLIIHARRIHPVKDKINAKQTGQLKTSSSL